MKKGTLLAVGLFAILLIVVLATRERQVSVGIKRLEIAAIDKAKVQQIAMSGAKSAVLARTGSSWTVEDPAKPGAHPADDTQANSLVDAFSDTRYGDLVSDRSERHAEFEIDEAKGLHVRVSMDGSPPIELVFGKAATGGTYVRRAGQTDVYMAKGRFPGLARRDANGWRKHAIFALKADDMTSFAVHGRDGQGYAFERDSDGKWALGKDTVVPAGFRLDASAPGRAAQQLSTLTAQDFIDAPPNDDVIGLSGPHDEIDVQMKDGKSVVVELGHPAPSAADGGTAAAGNEPIPTRVKGDAQLYAVSVYVRNQLTQPLTALRDMTLSTYDAQKVKALAIRGAKPVTLEKDGTSWKVLEPKQLPPGADFDPAQVNTQLIRIRNLHAAKLVDTAVPPAQAGLAKVPTVEVTLEDGTKQGLYFGKEIAGAPGAKQVYVKGSADNALYAVYQTEKTRFDVGVDLFKKPPPPPSFGNQGGMKGLENLPPDVRRQLEAQLRQRAATPGGGR
jgi:hypothetical protein